MKPMVYQTIFPPFPGALIAISMCPDLGPVLIPIISAKTSV